MTSVDRSQRHTRAHRCEVCGGCDQDERGKGKRCSGFTSADGKWVRCSREEHAGSLVADGEGLYRHMMHGPCNCGVTHSPASGVHARAPSASSTRSSGGRGEREPEATYDYLDERGELLFQVLRFPPKRFLQRRPVGSDWAWHLSPKCDRPRCPCSKAPVEARRVPYLFPKLLAADASSTIYVAEGEKDVDALWRHGLVATCNPHGACKWKSIADDPAVKKLFAGRDVVILPDDDEPGKKHADIVAAWMRKVKARSVVVVPLPQKDAADFFALGGTVEQIAQLVEVARASEPEPKKKPRANAPKIEIGDWQFGLLRKLRADGSTTDQLRQISANAALILAHDDAWHGVLAWDEFAETIVARRVPPWRPSDMPSSPAPGDWTDEDTTRAQHWLSERYGLDLGAEAAYAAVRLTAHRTRVHPIRDELNAFEWDHVPRVTSWLTNVMGCDDTPYVRECASAFLVSAVARIFEPGCKVDTILIFEGEQGIFKSSVLRALFGDPWFLEMSLADVMSKDTLQSLRRKWGVEFPEFDGYTRGEQAHVKGWISRQVDTYRGSYERRARDYPRQIVGCATTNKYQYLADETGGRRFMPVRCTRGNVAMVRELRTQLWAEAVARFRSGVPWHVTDPEILDEFRDQQDARYRTDPWEELIAKWLETPSDVGKPRADMGVSITDVLRFGVRIEDGRIQQADANRAGACLRRLGWELGPRVRRGGARVRLYFPKRSEDAEPIPIAEDDDAQLGLEDLTEHLKEEAAR